MASITSGYIGQINPGNGTNYSLGSTAYGVCGTAAATAEKTVEMTGFTLITGATVHIKFTYANSAASPTLNINSTGAKAIVNYGTSAAGTTAETTGWQAGAVVSFTYDGTSWVRDQGYNTNTDTNTNTTYTLSSASNKITLTPSSGSAQNVSLSGDGIVSLTSTGNAISVAHTAYASGTAGPSANASPAHGGTFSVPYIVTNASGHVTTIASRTITLPSASTGSSETWTFILADGSTVTKNVQVS